MRKNVIALSAAFVGFFTASLGTNHFLNYREMSVSEWLGLWIAIALALYCLGIYTTALVFQQLSKQESDIEPSFLALGGVMGLLLGSLLIYLCSLIPILSTLAIPFAIVPISLLLSVLGIHIACRFERRKSHTKFIVLLFRALIPFAIALTLIAVYNNSFPGVTAPAEIRQQWADTKFSGYTKVVNSIKICQPIIERVGSVKFVAPTKGKNYVISEPGSSGHNGELTLEVVGDRGAGVANFGFHIFTDVSSVKLTYQDKTEKLVCRS
jgi:hypothetical protein